MGETYFLRKYPGHDIPRGLEGWPGRVKNSLFRDWAICFLFLPCAYFWDPVLFQHIPSCHPSLEGALSVSLLGAHLILPAPLLEMLTTTSFSSEGLAPAWHTVRTQQELTVFFLLFFFFFAILKAEQKQSRGVTAVCLAFYGYVSHSIPRDSASWSLLRSHMTGQETKGLPRVSCESS